MPQSAIKKTKLLSNIPDELPDELFQALYENKKVKIERIISKGHQSAPDFWYDQDWDEWVLLLKGSAGLRFEGQDDITILKTGDALLIPAGVKHQVAWTDETSETVWIAVHIF